MLAQLVPLCETHNLIFKKASLDMPGKQLNKEENFFHMHDLMLC
jgi:hypothetical protein